MRDARAVALRDSNVHSPLLHRVSRCYVVSQADLLYLCSYFMYL
jgi:hypothetical protein